MTLLWIALAGMTTLALIAPFDYEITIWLSHHKHSGFARIMGQSIFDGGSFGVGDIATCAFIGSAVVWFYLRYVKKFPRNSIARAYGIITLSSLVSGLLIVHGLKLLMGRPRPHAVLEGQAPFHAFFEPSSLERFWGSGSFPSGHAATMASLIVLIYIFPWTLAQRITFMVVIATLTVGMGMARCMSLDHWITDSVASFFLCWMAGHVVSAKTPAKKDQP